jgi:hypothetical protein
MAPPNETAANEELRKLAAAKMAQQSPDQTSEATARSMKRGCASRVIDFIRNLFFGQHCCLGVP